MEWKHFLSVWDGTASENRFHRLLLPLLAVTNLVSVVGWVSKDKTTVIVPHTISEQLVVSSSKANGGYKKAWGYFVAVQVGNITPGNAQFMVDNLSPLMSSELFSRFRTSVAQEIEDIKRNSLVTSFEPKQVIFEPETDKVFVIGRGVIEAIGGVKNGFERVFEVKVDLANGRPLITHLEAYQGAPRTVDYLRKTRTLQPEGKAE